MIERLFSRVRAGFLLAMTASVVLACGSVSVDSSVRLQRAEEAYASGDFNAAIVDLKTVLQDLPDDSSARWMLAESLLRTGDFAGSRREFERAVELLESGASEIESSSDEAQAKAEMFDKARYGLAVSQLALRDLAGAKKVVSVLVDENPDNLETRWLAAQIAFSAQENEDSRGHLQAVLRGSPEHAGGNLMLGLVHMREGRIYDAEQRLDRVLVMEPENDGVRVAVARIKATLNKSLDALEALIPLLEKASDDARVLRIFESLDLGEDSVYEDVKLLAERLRVGSPERAVADILEARALFLRGEFEQSAVLYEAAAASGGGRYAIVGGLLAYTRRGDRAAAQRLVGQWLESNPGDDQLREVLASNYLRANDLVAAVDEYERLLQEQGRTPAILNNLAWLYGETGDERAIDFAREAYRLAPLNVAVIDTLGWLLVSNGDYEEGVELLREAVDRAPEIAEIRYHLAEALVTIGASDEAGRVLADAMEAEAEFSPELPLGGL